MRDGVVSGYAVASDGAYIAYQTVGVGPVDVVWQFDWFGNVDAVWELPFRREWFLGLAAFSRVILHDRRGTGASSRNVPAPNLEIRVSDLLAVLDAVGVDRPVVLGGVFEGGAPNVLLAGTYPERVHSIVWFSPMARSTWTPDYPWGARPEYVEGEGRATAAWGTTEYGRRFLDYSSGEEDMTLEDAELIGKISRQMCTPDMARALADIWYQTDVRGALPAVRTPALLTASADSADDAAEVEYVAALMPGATVETLAGYGPSVAHLEAVRRFLGVEPRHTAMDTVLSTVLFTDIVGSTEHQASLGDHAWKELVERHHATVRKALGTWRGVENDTAGDGFYATFDGPARAIHCALEIRDRVQDLGIHVRAGIHTGECELIDGKCAGIAVTTGARIAARAEPSQVLVSQTVKDLVAGSGFTFEPAGEHELKGVPNTWRLYTAT